MAFAPKRILVPLAIDLLGEEAWQQHIVDVATDVAIAFTGELALMTVVSSSGISPGLAQDITGETRRVAQELLDARMGAAEKKLLEHGALAKARGVSCELLVRSAVENVPRLICEAIEEWRADLVVMGSHGRRKVHQLLLGTVAERVAHTSPKPVLLIRR